MKRKHSRKTIIVDLPTQIRIVLATSFPMIACLALALVGEVAYQRALANGWFASDGMFLGVPESRVGMLLLFVSASTLQVVASLLASQKVTGVAYHVGRVLQEFRSGKRDARVRLRKGDYQQQLGDDVNEFLAWIDSGKSGAPQSGAAAKPHGASAGEGRQAKSPGSGVPS
ncbi:MAG: hypothetical protein DHS20C21_04100 [Gemmatimonadota bacterium]|nr:MAG: hypothetical protein DHS20C21_04100 [Gemmatimonadota bacterium]